MGHLASHASRTCNHVEHQHYQVNQTHNELKRTARRQAHFVYAREGVPSALARW
jgi:hypothetical protein